MKDSCLFLVVPDHAHSKSVSILLGTNNLERLFKNKPATELKDEGLQRVYQCIAHRDQLLEEQGGVLAVLLYQGHDALHIASNTWIEVPVKLRKYVSHPQTHALVERMPNPTVKELDVSPALHVLNSEKSLFISLHNTSNRTIRLVPGTQVAQMSPITVASMVDSESPVLPDVRRVHISPSGRESLQELLNEWKDVFSQNDLDLGHYDGVKHKIDLTDEHPFKQRYRRIPPHMLEEPSHLPEVMEDCFDDINLKDMFVYIDDIIVFSTTMEEHLEKLRKVFCRLRDCGLKLAPQKCELLQREISFLGYQVSEAGIHTDPGKVQKVRQWKTPRKNKELASFLGFASYYRQLVSGYNHSTTGDLSISDPPSDRALVIGLELATKGSLQIRGWMHYPLYHQAPHQCERYGMKWLTKLECINYFTDAPITQGYSAVSHQVTPLLGNLKYFEVTLVMDSNPQQKGPRYYQASCHVTNNPK
ncbi:Pol polyprotein [Plakobranchus ocellatus]|uniref:Pol polyprotein n=1 Tax=Plakobranchus ocellatus TaxID=259542 RepID=A0AAV3YLJ5_9GAST|nr:Pol polyprotein [Plakobranchus ocellatus]